MKPTFPHFKNNLCRPAGMACILTSAAMAQTAITWDGDVDTDYATGANWVGEIAPADDLVTNIAQFTGGTVNLGGNRSVAGFDFDSGSVLDFDDVPGVVFTLGAAGIEVNANSDIFGGELQFNQDIVVTFAGGRLSTRDSVLSGTGKLTVTGGNTLFVDGTSNTYSGGTDVEGGANFSFKGLGGFGTGNISLNNGKISGNGTPNLVFGSRIVTLEAGGGTMTTLGGRWSFTSVNGITGTGGLTVDGGNNNIFFDSANDFSGALTIKGTGRVGAKGSGTLGDNSGFTNNIFLEDGGTLFSNGSSVDTGTRVINLVGTGGVLATNGARIGVGGVITGAGALTVGTGNNTVFLDNTGNDYLGGTIVQGLIRPKADGTLGDVAGVVTMDGGTLYPNQGGVTYPSTRNFVLTALGGTITSNGTTTIEGEISGVGDLIVNGTGTVVLSGTNSYMGNTSVVGGTLSLGDGVNSSGLPDDSTVIVEDPGILNLNFSGTDTIGSLFVDGVQVDAGTYDMADFPGIITGGGSLEVTTGPDVPSIVAVEVDGSGNVILSLDGSEAGLTVQQSDDLDTDAFSDVPSTSPGANQLQIDAADADPNADGADFYQLRN